MSRSSIVGMLIAVEIVIVGIAAYAICGAHRMRGVDFVAKPIAPIAAGTSPRVTIDDVDSRVAVAASSDGLVHVRDLSGTHGAFFGNSQTVPQLDVKRTADGVSISRPGSTGFGMHFQIGWSERRVEVDVPAGSHVDISRCAGAEIAGVEGGVAVTSQDGRITLSDLSGTVQAKSDDGSIYATRVRGDNLTFESADGRLSLVDVSAASLDAQTKDGSIEARDLAIAGAEQPHAVIHTGDGSIHITLAARPDLTVDASTQDGKIIVDGESFRNADGDSAQHTVKLGSGAGSLQLSSGDGSIHLLTNGAV
ncbi:MAG: DUF4097 family beta strand repeat-containing protein [Candidatus Tumulicola sp.]